MSLSAVVQRLQVLEMSGLVRFEERGRVRTCRVDTRTLAATERWLSRRCLLRERRLDRLDEILPEESDSNA